MKKQKIALITGITGQDGSHLADFLLEKNYKIIGVKRRSSSFNTERIDHIYNNKKYKKKFIPFYADLTDSSSLLVQILNIFFSSRQIISITYFFSR